MRALGVEVLGLCETHLNESGETTLGEEHVMIASSDPKCKEWGSNRVQ